MNTLPMHPAEAVPIGTSCFAFARGDGQVVYFSNLEPFDFHDEGDRGAMKLRIAKFARSGIPHRDLQCAFGVSRTTVHRALVQLQEAGEASFHAPRRGRGTHVIDAAMATRANRLLAAGRSGAAVARELGIAKSTLNYNRQKGFIGGGAATREETAPEAADAGTGEVRDAPERRWDRSARDGRDREAPMGRGARDTTGRVLASTGALAERAPQFAEPLFAVAGGGVLAALPMLLREGLLDRTREFLSLPKGYYGLSSVLLLLAFLFLARMRTPEALRHQAPGEWGALLGLDRCPEVKTLRRKIRALGRDPQRVRAWQNALAEAWLAAEPEVCATLAVDGHVKVYSGRKGRLPKHFVSRQKLCLPASTSYWINALGGQPFLCLNKDLDPTMTRALEADILPALERLGLPGPEAPDLTASPEAEPALTLVFDREGWSPALFARLARRGIAVITWHKGFRGEPWPEADFRTVTVPIHVPAATRTVTVRLAEKRVRLNAGPEVRQIRRRLDSGRQVPLVTTNGRMPLERVAGAMFSRWSQENFFKTMREAFNLDALPVHALADPDPEARVVNPAWRERDRHIRRLRQKLGTLRNRIADLSGRSDPSPEAVRSARRLQRECDTLDAEREALKIERKAVPRHITVAELGEDEKLDALPSGEKLLLDVIRMIAYRAETRMMPAIAEVQGTKPRPRRPLQALFGAAADVIPEPGEGILRVRILGSASNAGDAAIAGLLDELNQTRTIFPGTELRMVYELPRNGTDPETGVSK
ncbi:MAG: hypothetical protein OXN81_01675 [Alphaproteobacteria bacterium]|nr:hypothetical protein [Alphaproteobacteria bacterium]